MVLVLFRGCQPFTVRVGRELQQRRHERQRREQCGPGSLCPFCWGWEVSITNEQLDAIEKLASDPKSAAFHDLMARQTIPLVKALREAQELSKVRREEAFDWTSAYFEAQRERDEARAEVERLKAERDEARKWLEGICSEFEGAVAHADWRAAGSKGMSVPFFGDFADATRHPGMIGRMRWWVNVFRDALKERE